MTEYLPEGSLINTAKNKNALASFENLETAMKNKTIQSSFAPQSMILYSISESCAG